MQEIIDKAAVLIEALPYIQRFRDEVIVVKFGGSAMEDERNVRSVLRDVTLMECVGMLPVVVHGGGKAISRRMEAQGIEPRFLKGLRVTCERSIEVVSQVLQEEVNPGIVSILCEMGAPAEPVRGESILSVSRKRGVDPDTGDALDWGFVGEPEGVETGPLESLLDSRVVPVIAPLGRGSDGQLYNVNADTAAAAVAKALKARKLAYLSDVPGLLRDAGDPGSIIPTVRASELEGYIAKGIVAGGMIPKLRSGVDALRAGVKKIHLVDGRMSHSLLLEIFTDRGVGTEIISDEQ